MGTRRPTPMQAELSFWLFAALAWFLFLLSHQQTLSGQWVSNLGLVVAPLYACLCAAHRAVRLRGHQRWGWGALALSALSWALGQAAWSTYESFLGREIPFPSYADLGYLTALPFLFLGLCLLPRSSMSTATRVRSVLDGLVIAMALLVLSWEIALGRTMLAGSGSLLMQGIGLAYPVGDIVSATLALMLVARLRHGSGLTLLSTLLLVAGVLGSAVADSGFLYLTNANAYYSGHLIDLGWFLGYLSFGFAARTAAAPPGELGQEDPRRHGQIRAIAPYPAVALAIGAAGFREVTAGRLGSFMAWSMIGLLCLVVLRQILTSRENLTLTGFLEARVRERTQALAEREQWFRSLVQNSSDVVSVVAPDSVVTYVTPSAKHVLDLDPAELLGKRFTSILDPNDGARLLQTLSDAAISGSIVTMEGQIRTAGGRCRDAELTITSLIDDPYVKGLVINARDVSERKALEAALSHQAFHDGLTGLANRALFKDRVDHALASRHRENRPIAVMFLDLDGFKSVNDSYGHASGDRLLIQVAQRLCDRLRAADTIARLGGDEFAVLLEWMDSDWNADAVARHLMAALEPPFHVDGREIRVQTSIGIAVALGLDDTGELLLRNADVAMYHAKAGGGGIARQFEPEMHHALVERLEIETDLRRALAGDEFVLHYQPIVDLAVGSIVGVEALLRWQHPTRGMIMPTDFISVAEETGQIVEIGSWVLNQACHWAGRRQSAASRLTVAVNISGRQLLAGSLVGTVRQALQDSGLPPQLLVLEMTESQLIENTDLTIGILLELKQLGLALAIDDFGTGYSSLSYLSRFPIDILKIDRSFIESMSSSQDKKELTEAIVRLGSTLRLRTVAEGIEQQGQLAVLHDMGCQRGQGYLFSYALPADEVDVLIAAHEAALAPGPDRPSEEPATPQASVGAKLESSKAV
jgi:diguanylate cyclase (GGDEF)-like protein/PAS domain S-box-containing protein